MAEGPRVSGQLGICCDLLSQKHKRNKTEAKGFSIAAPESVSLGGGGRNSYQMTKLFCGNIHVAPDGVLVALSVDRPGASSAASRPVPCAHPEHRTRCSISFLCLYPSSISSAGSCHQSVQDSLKAGAAEAGPEIRNNSWATGRQVGQEFSLSQREVVVVDGQSWLPGNSGGRAHVSHQQATL